MLEEDEKIFKDIEEMTIFVRISAPQKYKETHDVPEILNNLKSRLELIESLQEKVGTIEEEVDSLKSQIKTIKSSQNVKTTEAPEMSENTQQT